MKKIDPKLWEQFQIELDSLMQMVWLIYLDPHNYILVEENERRMGKFNKISKVYGSGHRDRLGRFKNLEVITEQWNKVKALMEEMNK